MLRINTLIFLAVFGCVAWCVSTAQGQELSIVRYGQYYPVSANSVVDISRIGRDYSNSYYRYWYRRQSSGPIRCHTDNPMCCRAIDDPVDNEENGDWFYPDGTVVGSSGSGFYVTRDRMDIKLNRYSSSTTGVFCCDIPSVNATLNTTLNMANSSAGNVSSSAVCIGIYSAGTLRTCPDLSISAGYVRYDTPHIPGRVATFSCTPRYSLVGPTTRTCSVRGWSGYSSSCQRECGRLSNPRNGKVNTSQGTTRGRTATYSCSKGYKLIGRAYRRCGSYGTWSSSAPYCVDQVMLQIKFGPTEYCLKWDAGKANQMKSIMHAAMQVGVLKSRNVTSISFENGFFSCRDSFDQTTYRVTVLGTGTISAFTLVDDIQKWVKSAPSVRVGWYVVDIDKRCPVKVQSMYEKECVDPQLQRCVDVCYNAKYKHFTEN